jgi:hypothetical protein
MLNASKIVALQDRCTAAWHETPLSESAQDPLLSKVELQHAENFKLWHHEDDARLHGVALEVVVEAKRAIDCVNQRRNDLIEQIDTLLLEELAKSELPDSESALHSETPGMIIDRLSILSLKIYHTQEEVDRKNAPAGHRERNQERLRTLQEQRNDLAYCLDELWHAIEHGTRRFKRYRQLKMYNDPELNPALYGKDKATSRG